MFSYLEDPPQMFNHINIQWVSRPVQDSNLIVLTPFLCHYFAQYCRYLACKYRKRWSRIVPVAEVQTFFSNDFKKCIAFHYNICLDKIASTSCSKKSPKHNATTIMLNSCDGCSKIIGSAEFLLNILLRSSDQMFCFSLIGQ